MDGWMFRFVQVQVFFMGKFNIPPHISKGSEVMSNGNMNE